MMISANGKTMAAVGRSPIMVLLGLALGLFMLQDGLRIVRDWLWRRELQASRAPVGWDGSFGGWRDPLTAEGMRARWYVVVAAAADGRPVCGTVAALLARTAAVHDIMVLEIAADLRRGRSNCAVLGVPASLRTLLRPPVDLGSGAAAMLPRGFLVMDSAFQVVYGSQRMGDLRRVADVLEVFDAPAHIPVGVGSAGGSRDRHVAAGS